jgi:hypothetical protein
MTQRGIILLPALILFVPCAAHAQQPHPRAYPGFDRNDYPGDASLPALRKSFCYTGYWLNNPPGEQQNTWAGKRALLKQYGFGFLVLSNGRSDADLKAAEQQGTSADALGAQDGNAAATAAEREGFPANVRIFLDQEEGGRLLPEQAAYLFAWIDAVRRAGARPGVYCSGIGVPEGSGTISTAEDIADQEIARTNDAAKDGSAERKDKNTETKGKNAEPLALWISNDQCPPSPGCTLANPPLSAAISPSTAAFAMVWQYAQSPRRAQFSASCPANQAADGNCYAPGTSTFVDLNTASSPDPSEAP